jgi:hypothetical protein
MRLRPGTRKLLVKGLMPSDQSGAAVGMVLLPLIEKAGLRP